MVGVVGAAGGFVRVCCRAVSCWLIESKRGLVVFSIWATTRSCTLLSVRCLVRVFLVLAALLRMAAASELSILVLCLSFGLFLEFGLGVGTVLSFVLSWLLLSLLVGRGGHSLSGTVWLSGISLSVCLSFLGCCFLWFLLCSPPATEA